MPRIITAALAATALAAGIMGASSVTSAQDRPRVAASAGLPDALRRAAIAARSDRAGRIAGARIGDTATWVVFMMTASGCGSGGCRAQVWRSEGGRFVRRGSMPVGRLPIVVLPQAANGMPVLGVTVFDKRTISAAIQPVGFDGKEYSQQDGDLLPAGTGRPLLTPAMLRSF